MLEKYVKMSLLDRMVVAVERVRERLERATRALQTAGIPYAVVGGNAAAVWVATVDAAAVRNTQDVDILLRRPDMNLAIKALQGAGFIYQEVAARGIIPGWAGCHAARRGAYLICRGENRRTSLVAGP